MPALLSPEQDQDEALNKGQQDYEERFNSGAGMPTLLSPEQDQDEALNKGQQDYEQRFNAGGGSLDDLQRAEELARFNDVVGGANSPSELKTIDDLDGGDQKKYTGDQGTGKQSLWKTMKMTKKKGGMLAVIVGLLGGGGVMVGLFGPIGMIFNLADNIGITNDSASVAMERRFIKAFAHMADPDNPVCNSTKITVKCRMGRMSNSALNTLNKKGVTVTYGDGSKWDGKKTGYSKKGNPTVYTFTSDDGSTKNVMAKDLRGFLTSKDNRKFAAQILGRKGAFNMRTKAWVGKHISSKLYKPFGIERKGGLADGENKGKTTRERVAAALEKHRKSIPGMQTVDKISDNIKAKADKHMSKAGKGGVAYATAFAGCIAIKAPSYIAVGVAAVQLAQVMPFFMDYIGSPASKAKQSGIGSGFTGEDMDTVGSSLTEKVNGKSALDSQILLSVMGVNKSKAPVDPSVTPGYALINNDKMKLAQQAEGASEEACSAIMSPTAMYTAMAVDAAVTVAASATVIGGLIKIAASWAITEVGIAVAQEVIGAAAKNALTDIAENDSIPKAKGEQLGNVIGISAAAFFAAGAMSRHLPVLKKSQLVGFENMKAESQEFQKEMDIASLSPFDTSSPYTFLGSIVHNTRTAMLASGGYSGFASGLSTLASVSLSSLFAKTNAATFTSATGNYASDFNLALDNEDESPCITVSGLPCTGLTTAQASMSTADAITYLENEGWIDTEASTKDGSITSDLVKSVIKEDTPLSEFMESCSDASTGDYILNAAGCTSITTNADYSAGAGKTTVNGANKDGGDAAVDIGSLEGVSSEPLDTANDPNALAAMTPFLLDYQIIQSINGEDEEKGDSKKSGGEVGELVGDKAYPIPKGSVQNTTTYANHGGVDFPAAEQTPIFAVAAGTVTGVFTSCTEIGRGDGVCGGERGNYVQIDHGSGVETRYLHMYPGSVLVKEGDTVSAGTKLGVVGSTGNSTGDHLHFDVWENGARIGDDGSFNWLKRYNILPSVNQDGLVYS